MVALTREFAGEISSSIEQILYGDSPRMLLASDLKSSPYV